MTPVEIMFLLHCYCVRTPYHNPSPAIDEAKKSFLCEDLIIEDMHDDKIIYVTTPRGNAMCEMLMTTPLPERVWIDPRDKEILG